MSARVSVSSLQIVANAAVRSSRQFPGLKSTPLTWICRQCQRKSSNYTPPVTEHKYGSRATQQLSPMSFQHQRRSFSLSQRRTDAKQQNDSPADHDLPSKQEFRRSKTSRQLSHMMDNLQANIFVAGQRLNDLTGYSAIETLKKEIQAQEATLQSSREELQAAKEDYTQAIKQRSQSQREVNELLQRKHAWSPQDLERFTELYRSDHANELAEAEAQAAVAQAERTAEETAARLSANILARYHEEQIWSDKIRRMSTWGTWGLMGVNVLLFLIFQIGVEPWRRKRLVKGFEDKVVEALEKETAAQRSIAATTSLMTAVPATDGNLEKMSNESRPKLGTPEQSMIVIPPTTTDLIDGTIPKLPSSIGETYDDGTLWRMWAKYCKPLTLHLDHLFSTQTIAIRQVDVTAKFVEGALSSIVVISLLSAMLRNKT